MSVKLAFALINLLLGSSNIITAMGDASSVLMFNHPSNNGYRQLEEMLNFQLKMYWEEGYFWQEETIERFWCAECDGDSCGEGDTVHIQKCDEDNDNQRFVYEDVPSSGGGRIKPLTRQDLCWTSLGANRGRFELLPCDNNCRQIIVGPQYGGGRFEMQPLGRPDFCLEQHHHPRKNELIRASECESSRNDDTSYWVMFNEEGFEKTTDTSTTLYGDCGPHVLPTIPPSATIDPPTNDTVATTISTIATTTVAPPDTTASSALDCNRPDQCTEEVLNTDAGGFTCRARMSFLIKYQGLSEVDACNQIASIEFPTECGPCNPTAQPNATTVTTITPSDATITTTAAVPPISTATTPAPPVTAPPITTVAATTVAPPMTTVAATTVAPPMTTVAATTVAPPITTVPPPMTTKTTTVALPITTVATTAAPPTTKATTVAPPTTTTVAPSITQPPASTGSCELDDNGFFGKEAPRPLSVDYFYELVIDPDLGDGSTMDDIIANVGRNVLTLLLPTLFGDDCTVDESSGQRRLANAAVGAKTGPAGSVVGVSCVGLFSEGHNCTVVVASMTVFTNKGEDNYDTLLLPVIESALTSGRLNDVDPAVVNVAYLSKPGDAPNNTIGDTNNNAIASESVSSGGMDDTKLIIAASVGGAAFLLAAVALIVVASRFRRKQKLQSATTPSDTITPPKVRSNSWDESRADNVPSEVYEWPDRPALQSVLSSSHGPRAEQDERYIQPVLPTRTGLYIDI